MKKEKIVYSFGICINCGKFKPLKNRVCFPCLKIYNNPIVKTLKDIFKKDKN